MAGFHVKKNIAQQLKIVCIESFKNIVRRRTSEIFLNEVMKWQQMEDEFDTITTNCKSAC